MRDAAWPSPFETRVQEFRFSCLVQRERRGRVRVSRCEVSNVIERRVEESVARVRFGHLWFASIPFM